MALRSLHTLALMQVRRWSESTVRTHPRMVLLHRILAQVAGLATVLVLALRLVSTLATPLATRRVTRHAVVSVLAMHRVIVVVSIAISLMHRVGV